MLIALVLSILFSLAIGITAARNKRAEAVIIPLLDVFQSIPILGFFPIVILAVVNVIPGQIGISVAVIILIFTSMSWNIAFGVYEAVKSIPQDYIDLSEISQSSTLAQDHDSLHTRFPEPDRVQHPDILGSWPLLSRFK